jgi:hypothetical protein
VLGGTTVLPDVLIRAYVVPGTTFPTNGPGSSQTPGVTLVQVAETSADATGRFELLVPTELDPSQSATN